ncbi:helix-turn-helix transcriptional regulator [Litoribacter alkaliphilus]|uniref:Helix-turn-helix transcriptional regulator n=1 Tax=Litoribacter ruber TaxID=702568 RepID=A0AAP2CJJ0_9BACT|nr:helix-turn-helix transcriptional regulator [Litoribacter alkaliphilus]MBS9525928.1 helix-turn-helix transcriptional regulator [Litoribacter alkaliphilus]
MIIPELRDMAAKMKPRDVERMRKFRELLIRFREEKGLGQRELSLRCDIHHSKISVLEKKEDSSLTLTTLFELARGLGVHPKELIDYDFDFSKRNP